MPHTAQTNYINAKSAYEAANAVKKARMAPHEHLLDAQDFEQYTDLEMAVDADLGIDGLHTALRSAEERLIAWCIDWTRNSSAYNAEVHEVALQAVYSNRHKLMVRTKILDAAVRLAV